MLPMDPTDTCTLRIAPKVWKYVTGRQNAPRIISAGYLGCVSHKKQPSSKSLLQIDLLIGSASFLDTELLGPMAQAHLCSFSRNTDKVSCLDPQHPPPLTPFLYDIRVHENLRNAGRTEKEEEHRAQADREKKALSFRTV